MWDIRFQPPHKKNCILTRFKISNDKSLSLFFSADYVPSDECIPVLTSAYKLFNLLNPLKWIFASILFLDK